jgi:hypothetical protein
MMDYCVRPRDAQLRHSTPPRGDHQLVSSVVSSRDESVTCDVAASLQIGAGLEYQLLQSLDLVLSATLQLVAV